MKSVFIVISKQTGNIMGVYSNYLTAGLNWSENIYSIMEFPVLDK